MSSTIDTNVLVRASNEDDALHARAVELIRRLAAGPELVYLFWPVLLGYLRIVTHPAILPSPLPGDRAPQRRVAPRPAARSIARRARRLLAGLPVHRGRSAARQ